VIKPGKNHQKQVNGCLTGILYKTLEEAHLDGAITINYGRFFQNLINFLFVGVGLLGFFQSM
jgi:large-conductance mechanosensitive channel